MSKRAFWAMGSLAILMVILMVLAFFIPVIVAFVTGRYSWVDPSEMLALRQRAQAQLPDPFEDAAVFPGPILVVWEGTGGVCWDVQGRLPGAIQSRSEDALAVVAFVERRETQTGVYQPSGDPAYETDAKITVVTYPEGTVIAIGHIPGSRAPEVKSHRGEYRGSGPGSDPIVTWVADHYMLPIPGALQGHETAVSRVMFTPGGALLISGDQDGAVIVWDVASRRPVRHLVGRDVTLSPNGGRLATVQDDQVAIVDFASGADVLRFAVPSGECLSFSPDGKVLLTMAASHDVSGEDDTVVSLWDAASGALTGQYSVSGRADELKAAPDWSVVAVEIWRQDEHELELRSLADGLLVRAVGSSGLSGGGALAFSPDGSLLAFDGNNQVYVTYAASGTVKRFLKKPGDGWITQLAFSPDGAVLAGGYSDQVILWDAKSGKVLRRLTGHRNLVCCVAFSPDGSLLASGSADKTVRLWDVKR
jgi:WD40 repeat protein